MFAVAIEKLDGIGFVTKKINLVTSQILEAKNFKTREEVDEYVLFPSFGFDVQELDGKEVILAMMGLGDFFGEMSLLDGRSRSANIISLEKTEVLTLNREDFLEVLQNYPNIAIQLIKEMALRLRKSDRHIVSLSLSDAEKRIALCIIRFADEKGTIKNGKVNIKKIPIQQDIANMAGTSRETVSRAMKILEDESFISRDGKNLTILDYKKFIKEFDS